MGTHMTKERNLIGIVLLLAITLAIIAAIGAFELDTSKLGDSISASLQLKDSLLKKYTYPEVRSNIFSSFAPPPAPAPVFVPPPKKELPPPVDPYEQYYRDLKTYQIFGFSKDGDNKIVFLSRGDATYTLKKGDTFGDKYIVKDISDTELTVGMNDDANFKYVLSQNK